MDSPIDSRATADLDEQGSEKQVAQTTLKHPRRGRQPRKARSPASSPRTPVWQRMGPGYRERLCELPATYTISGRPHSYKRPTLKGG